MRRLIVLVAIVVLTGAMLASAALLDVDGGTLQGFRFDVDVEAPDEASCVDDADECGDREQQTDGEDARPSEEETDPPMPTTTTTEGLDEGSTSTTAPTTETTSTTEMPIKTETTVAPQPPESRAIELP